MLYEKVKVKRKESIMTAAGEFLAVVAKGVASVADIMQFETKEVEVHERNQAPP